MDYITGLVEDQVDLDVFRRYGLHCGQSICDTPDDLHRGSTGSFGHRNVNGALFVDLRIADYDVGGIGDTSDVAQIDGRAGAQAYGLIQQFVDIRAESCVGMCDANEVAGPDVA